MIDTIVLTLPQENFKIITSNLDDGNWNLQNKTLFFEKYVKNLSTAQKNDGVYRPKVKLIKRKMQYLLQIEFSVPKLIFGNNVDEVCENDFETILQTLQTRLSEFEINVTIDHLRKASVSVFHPSKNILLSNGYTASGVIKELKKINLTKKMDLSRESFRNNGQSIQLYANSHSLVIYDKMQDIKKPTKRAIDKDPTLTHSPLLKTTKAHLEILRIEVRLTNKVKMNTILVKNGMTKNPNFQEIFQNNTCQKIVSSYWSELIVKENLFLFSLSSNSKDTLRSLVINNPKIKPKEAVYLVGLSQLCKDEDGVRELREQIERQSVSRTWYRMAKDLQKLNLLQNSSACHDWLRQVNIQLKEFEVLKSDYLQCKEK